MSVNLKVKADLIQQFGRNAADTGSSSVQVALLTQGIALLTEHLKVHKKDFHSRRGLIRMVNRRRKLLTYLKNKAFSTYSKLVQDLGLRG